MNITVKPTGVSVEVTPYAFHGMVGGQLLLIGCTGWTKEVENFMLWQLEGAKKTLARLEDKLRSVEMEHSLAVAETISFKKPNGIVASFLAEEINEISIHILNIEEDIYWMRNAVNDIETVITPNKDR